MTNKRNLKLRARQLSKTRNISYTTALAELRGQLTQESPPEQLLNHEFFEELREILHRDPSKEAWDDLRRCLFRIAQTAETVLPLAVEYAAGHLERWPRGFRVINSTKARGSFHGARLSLARTVSMRQFMGGPRITVFANGEDEETQQRILEEGYRKFLADAEKRLDKLFETLPSHIEGLHLYQSDLNCDIVAMLAKNPGLLQLKSLNLSSNHRIDDEGWEALFCSPYVQNLERLVLVYNSLSGNALRMLLTSPNLAKLKNLSLAISLATPEDNGLEAFSDLSFCLTELESIDLMGWHIGDEDISHIASCDGLRRLKSLGLQQNDIGPDGARTLVRSSSLSSLVDVNMCNNLLGVEGEAVFRDAPYTVHFTTYLGHVVTNRSEDPRPRGQADRSAEWNRERSVGSNSF